MQFAVLLIKYLNTAVKKKIPQTVVESSNLCLAIHFDVYAEVCRKYPRTVQWIRQQGSEALGTDLNSGIYTNFSIQNYDLEI